ncbi:hypothetical protein R1sor_026449 [Riccia sorocarpa]|uniref:PPM-type phosphatase domain-containing protein n=1 Tax=Riccia sorocarpa TaxID=122646 RepID=A0ABD3GD24_9MARC
MVQGLVVQFPLFLSIGLGEKFCFFNETFTCCSARYLSKLCQPDREVEMARVEAAGGRVIFWNGYRVLGVLAMSRAIDDDLIMNIVFRFKTILNHYGSREAQHLWPDVPSGCLISLGCGNVSSKFTHKTLLSPPSSPPKGPRELTGPVLALQDKLRTSPQLGIVHLALHSDQIGMIMNWKSDIISVAEPGEMAEGFLQTVVANMRIGVTGKARKKRDSQLPKFSSFSSLVASCPRFMIVGGLHRFMGRHTQFAGLNFADSLESGAHVLKTNTFCSCFSRFFQVEPSSPGSDWEDSDLDKLDSSFESQEREEKDLASFISTLYDALFRDGLGVEAALEHALEAHVKQQYRCHLPQFF